MKPFSSDHFTRREIVGSVLVFACRDGYMRGSDVTYTCGANFTFASTDGACGECGGGC